MYSLYFITLQRARNKTTYEAPSFHTSGTPRNVPYTVLTHNHICIYIYTHVLVSPQLSFAW